MHTDFSSVMQRILTINCYSFSQMKMYRKTMLVLGIAVVLVL